MLQGFVISLTDLERCDVGGLKTLGALFDFELDLLAFFQGSETISLNRGEVNEDIFAAIVGKKAVAFAPVEPFDCAGDTFGHCVCLLMAKEKRYFRTLFRCIGQSNKKTHG